MKKLILFAVLVSCAGSARAQVRPVLDAQGFQVSRDEKTRRLSITYAGAGPVLDSIVISARVRGKNVSSDGPKTPARVTSQREGDAVAITFGGALPVRIAVRDGELQLTATGKLDGPAALRAGAGPMGARPYLAILKDQAKEDNAVLVTTVGDAEVPGVTALYDSIRDVAVNAGPAGKARWSHEKAGWWLRSAAPAGQPLLTLKVTPHYYRDTLGIKYYAPMVRRPPWRTAPVVAMTWYGIAAMNGRPAQVKERLYPQIDWVAEHLLPYAGPNLVFQLDDNYPERDDAKMRELSDYIRKKGLVPGIWFTPFTVAPKEEVAKHPEWFIHDAQGKSLPTFGGISYPNAGTLNVTNPEAVKAWYGMWWKKASETWNFDFFKIDGEPNVVAAYRKATDGGGIEGYRSGLKLARDIVGQKKFINGCWGTPVEGIGLMDGSRTGGDTGYDPHAINVILQWNFLNNVAWWCDPDAAADLWKATPERARLNAQARVLTGQQFLTDDTWTRVPPAICRIWQESFPNLDIRPVNLYPIGGDWKRYDVFDLRSAKPWGTSDVVGLFNYDGRPAQKTLDLARLPLAAGEVHVFDYWRSEYLGRHKRSDRLTFSMAPFEGKLFSLTPAVGDQPALISTSRHLTQGALDLEKLSWKRDGKQWIATGRSTHLVKGDPYELVFAGGRYAVIGAKATGGTTTVGRGAGAERVAIVPAGPEVEWRVVFKPITGALLELSPPVLELAAGASGTIALRNLGPARARFRLRASAPRLHLSLAPGILGPYPARLAATVTADADDLPPGQVLPVTVTVEADGCAPQQMEVRVHAPEPENLAAKAKASASSVWSDEYGPERAIDGDGATRWNPAKANTNGCWLDLTWPQPVRFDTVVVDECMDFGPRIQQWHLLAGDTELKEIAKGTDMGAAHTITLPQPVEAKRLRLLVDRATDTPTIWEVKVQRVRREP